MQDQRAGGTDKQNLRLIMLPSDVADLHDPDDILSNRRRPLTAILNECEVAYDCGMRLRGSMFSRQNAATTGLNIQMPSDRPFRGSIPTITVRRAGLQEVVVKHIIARSGGIPNSYNDVVYLAGHTASQTGVARLEMARYGTAWAEGAYPDGGDGTVFKMEGIREFQATLDGNPESRKKPFNPIGWVPAFDLADQGDDRETYRHNLRINSNFDKDDYGAIIQMAKLFSLTGAEMEARAPEVIDVDAWMRQFALLSLCGIGDTYSQGNPHNLNFYVRPADGKVIPMPWDWDFTFNRPTDSPLWGNRNLANLIQIPQFNRLFLGHLRDLINTSFNTGYMDPWLAHFNACAGTQTTAYSNYIAARGAYVLTQLPAAVAFAITTNGGADFSVGDSFVDLEGSGWIDVREIRLANGTALAVDWLNADSWRLRVPLSPGANAIALTAIDFQGNAVGTASINVSNSGSVARASAEFLAVRELHFHPADDAATEFVELANLSGSLALDLTGVAFSAGIDFAFPDGFQIPAGGRAVVVQDAAAFAAEYGAGLPVAGEFANATRLANGGERIALADAFGAPIADFTYGDAFPWPAAADGGGYSAVLIAGGDPGDPLDWRHSALPGGSPGVDDADPAPADPLADADRDGLPAFAEAALGRSDGDGSDAGIGPAVWVDAEGHLNVAFIRHLPAESARLAAEASADLIDWSVPLDYTAEVPNGDGTATVTWRSTEPFTAAEAFGAVRAESRE
ncbi:MAG: CotH kinase family protein [Verrucomicrobiales bacterium]